MSKQERWACPQATNTRLLKPNGTLRGILETWTRQWTGNKLDVYVLTDDGNLYKFPTYTDEFTRFLAPLEVKDYKGLLRRVKHLWIHPGWQFVEAAVGQHTPPPQ